nr:MAG TPA: hypothetical protein [Caudoviricetes sp.]
MDRRHPLKCWSYLICGSECQNLNNESTDHAGTLFS